MREHLVGVHIWKVYTNITLLLTWRLQSWHKGDCTASAHHHSLWQTAQCECQPVRGAQAVVAYLRDCPLTWRRNTQIQLYWLWKWLESYNNCTFSTWKDKFLFNLLFWIPDSFCTYHDYARGGTPFSLDGPSLIFYHSDFWTTFLLWKNRVALKLFTAFKYFLSFRTFEQLVACPEKQSVPCIHCIGYIYIFLIIQYFEQLAHALKSRVCPEILHCIEIFLSFRIFEELALALKTEFVMTFFAAFNIRFTFRMFEQLLLAVKNRVCPEFTVLNVLFILQNFEQLALALKNSLPWKCSLHWNKYFWVTCACSENRVFPEIFHCIEYSFYIQDFWATCGLPWKTECALNSLYWIYIFYHSEFWTTCACPEKQNLPRNFSLDWNIFYLSGFLRNFSLPWKQSLPWIFQTDRGREVNCPPGKLSVKIGLPFNLYFGFGILLVFSRLLFLLCFSYYFLM